MLLAFKFEAVSMKMTMIMANVQSKIKESGKTCGLNSLQTHVQWQVPVTFSYRISRG